MAQGFVTDLFNSVSVRNTTCTLKHQNLKGSFWSYYSIWTCEFDLEKDINLFSFITEAFSDTIICASALPFLKLASALPIKCRYRLHAPLHAIYGRFPIKACCFDPQSTSSIQVIYTLESDDASNTKKGASGKHGRNRLCFHSQVYLKLCTHIRDAGGAVV